MVEQFLLLGEGEKLWRGGSVVLLAVAEAGVLAVVHVLKHYGLLLLLLLAQRERVPLRG